MPALPVSSWAGVGVLQTQGSERGLASLLTFSQSRCRTPRPRPRPHVGSESASERGQNLIAGQVQICNFDP